MKATTYDPVHEDAMVDNGADGEYVKVEHFDRAIQALAEIDAIHNSQTYPAAKFILISRVLDQHREFVTDNCLAPVVPDLSISE